MHLYVVFLELCVVHLENSIQHTRIPSDAAAAFFLLTTRRKETEEKEES